MGELLAKLKELGLEKNTIVIFASDNGPHMEGGGDPDFFRSNGNLRGYKRDLYEGGIRTPMIVKWPRKIKAGTTSAHISAFWDIMPTFAEISGADIPAGIDGISFLPTLLGNAGKQKQHEYLYWEFHEQGGKVAVLLGNWKGVKRDMDKTPQRATELYDLSVDEGETNDVAAAHQEIIIKIGDLMRQAHSPSEIFPFAFESSQK